MPDATAIAKSSAPGALEAIALRAQQLGHDLRTPIGTIATALELLRAGDTPFTSDDLETLDVLQRQVGTLTSLAESLRDLTSDLEARSRDAEPRR